MKRGLEIEHTGMSTSLISCKRYSVSDKGDTTRDSTEWPLWLHVFFLISSWMIRSLSMVCSSTWWPGGGVFASSSNLQGRRKRTEEAALRSAEATEAVPTSPSERRPSIYLGKWIVHTLLLLGWNPSVSTKMITVTLASLWLWLARRTTVVTPW